MNRPGVLICEKCGTNLATGKSQVSTKALEQEAQNQLGTDASAKAGTSALSEQSVADVVSPIRRGTDEFPKGGTLRLEVEGSSKSVQVPLTVHNREIVLGRRDPATGVLPDIDLTPFAGYRMGVSRRHCFIRYSEGKYLDLFDQGSSNGTFLNGQRMDAHYPYRLHDGDRIRLGQITIRMHFESGSTPPSANAKPPAANRATSPLGGVKPETSTKTAESSVQPESASPKAKPPSVEESTAVFSQDQSKAVPSSSDTKSKSNLTKVTDKVSRDVTEAAQNKVISLGPPSSDATAPPTSDGTATKSSTEKQPDKAGKSVPPSDTTAVKEDEAKSSTKAKPDTAEKAEEKKKPADTTSVETKAQKTEDPKKSD